MKKTVPVLLLLLLSVALPSGAEDLPVSHPVVGAAAEAPAEKQPTYLSGTVVQTMNGGGYSYINIQKKDGEKVWLAVQEAKVALGDYVSFIDGMVMKNFESKALKRTFDSIIFSSGIVPIKNDVSPAPSGQKEKKGSGGAAAEKEKISVAKAEGPNAYTVEEIYKKSAKLDKKTVVVRGKVVKSATGIMKKTWLHLQDGTGSAGKKNNDLVCTTRGTAEVGDTVTVTGTLAKDRDFGSGYKYGVIVEDGVIKK